MRTRFALVCLVSLSLLISTIGNAGTTGNIRGKITDIQTGEPLSLVNVLIVGSGRGSVSDDKGEYFVSGVTAGTFVVRASLLGYQTFEAKKVVIDADETSVQDFKLASTLIEKEGITVEGARPLVDVKKTAGEQTYNREKIEQLPNVKGVADVLGLQAGVVKFGSQLFLRGGRANETQILIDGVVSNDVGGGQSTNEQLAQLYSGNTAGGTSGALSVSANAIQSVSVSSSGLDAEYGNAQSGVVNITTKSGSEIYSGSLQYRTDGPTSNSFNERYYAASFGGPEPITQKLLPALGAEIPGKLSFFLSSTFNQSDGPYDYSKANFYNPLKRKVEFGGFFGDVLSGLGLTYTDKQDNEFAYNMKLSYYIGENDQFSFSYRANAASKHPLLGSFSSLNRYDSAASTISLKTQNVFQWQHILGTNSLIKAYISRLETDNTSNVAGLTPDHYVSVSTTTLDPNGDGFRDFGADQGWSHNNTVIWSGKFDYNSKVHELHFLKTGFEFYTEHIQSSVINFPLDPNRDIDSIPTGEFAGLGRTRFVTNNLPSRGAMYVQDNIEFSALTIRLGLRYDFFYPGKQVLDTRYLNLYRFVSLEETDWTDKTSFGAYLVRGNFSPRLAIGYPISERTVFYFNYGHFLQYPERNQYFAPPIDIVTEAITIGNPSLKPQKTVQYEAGFDQLIFEDFSLGIRGYYKDIFDYVATQYIGGRKDPTTNRITGDVTKWVNLDYASARGFEIILTKGGGGYYSGSVGYTFQLAKGRSSDPRASLGNAQLQGLPREVRLDFDQQHTLNLFVAYRVRATEEYDVLGLNINNWGASLTWNYGSGFPYTPFNFGRGLQDFYLKNTGDGPYTSEVNISLYKGFSFFDQLNVVFTLDVTNLLNRKNVDLNGGGFNSATGRVTSYGDYSPTDPRNIYAWNSFSTRVPPFAFRAPRQVAFGMKVNWN
jgi:outer membrane receptor protein involved in Fe transport